MEEGMRGRWWRKKGLVGRWWRKSVDKEMVEEVGDKEIAEEMRIKRWWRKWEIKR